MLHHPVQLLRLHILKRVVIVAHKASSVGGYQRGRSIRAVL
jgi:hypothetical protein